MNQHQLSQDVKAEACLINDIKVILASVKQNTVKDVIERFMWHMKDVIPSEVLMEVCHQAQATDETVDKPSKHNHTKKVRRRRLCSEYDLPFANALVNAAVEDESMLLADIKQMKRIVKTVCKQIQDETTNDPLSNDLFDGYAFMEIVKYMCDETGLCIEQSVWSRYEQSLSFE